MIGLVRGGGGGGAGDGVEVIAKGSLSVLYSCGGDC